MVTFKMVEKIFKRFDVNIKKIYLRGRKSVGFPSGDILQMSPTARVGPGPARSAVQGSQRVAGFRLLEPQLLPPQDCLDGKPESELETSTESRNTSSFTA